MNIVISKEIESVCPDLVVAKLEADVENSEHSCSLWAEIDALCVTLRREYTTETIKHIPGIEATRRMYKSCGKDPSRYRPSGEALLRRVLQGRELYRIDTLVDIINLASMVYGYSIGGFDTDKLTGDVLTLGVGRDNELYEGIGRGLINISSMPVYRDALGGVGTPTSDNERTKLDLGTGHLLVLVNGYDGDEEKVLATARFIQEHLRRYCSSDGGNIVLVDNKYR